jgi:hypothetical protein
MPFGWAFALGMCAVLGLVGQWLWITASALRSQRARTLRAMERLRRECQAWLVESRGEDDSQRRALVARLEALPDRLEGGEASVRFCEALFALRKTGTGTGVAAGGGSEASHSKEGSREGWTSARRGWMELALWDVSERLGEEERLWKIAGSAWVGRRLGVVPLNFQGRGASAGSPEERRRSP